MAYYSLPHIHYMHLILFLLHVHCNSSISCKFSCIKRLNNSFFYWWFLWQEESQLRIQEEEAKRKELSEKFQTTINDISEQMQENYKANQQLKNENNELVKQHFLIWLTCTLHTGGVCVWVVNTLNSGSGGPGFKPHPSPCFLLKTRNFSPLCLSSPRCINK